MEKDPDPSSPVEYFPFYPVWPAANKVLFQMVCPMHTLHVYGCVFFTLSSFFLFKSCHSYKNPKKTKQNSQRAYRIRLISIVLKFPAAVPDSVSNN